jgi:two-component system sensor histidine kinase KdpD
MNAMMTRQGLAEPTATGARNVKITAPISSYLVAAGACVATTVIATPLLDYFDPPNIVMLFLLTVLLVAMRFGRGPGVMAAFLSVGLFDFFFVPPRFSFAVSDMQYVLTFAVMLTVALITAHLAADLRRQALLAKNRAQRAHALYQMARALAGAVTFVELEGVTRTFLRNALAVDSAVLRREPNGTLIAASGTVPAWLDMTTAALASHESTIADLASSRPAAYFPLIASRGAYGVLAVWASDEAGWVLRDHAELLDTVASLVSIVVERLTRGD